MSPLSADDICAAFGVTRAEVDALDEASGMRAAREQAEAERVEFLRYMSAHWDRVAAELSRELGFCQEDAT